MRWTLAMTAVAGLVACHVDQLFHPGGSGNPSDSIPARVAFTTAPSHATAGSPLAPPVQVTVLDSSGQPATAYSGMVTLTLAANPAGGSLEGTARVAAANGVATFSAVSINTAGSGYVLSASTPGAAVATSNPIDVATAPAAPPTHLSFISQPQSTRAGDPISPSVQVAAEDSTGAVVPTYTGTITIALGANPGGGSLLGTRALSAQNGVATFSSVSISQAGSGYTLTAAASNLAGVTSQAFDITTASPPPPTTGSLVVTTTTTGSNLDTDGYTAQVDGGTSKTIGDNGSVTFDSISAGSHSVTLTGLATNCTVSNASQSATVPAGGSASVSFGVTCSAPPPPTTGNLTVSTSTGGSDLDPDGYSVSVDGGSAQSISDNGSVTFSNLPSGSHTATLTGVASNCSAGSMSQTVSVPAGGSSSAAFSITCQTSTPTNHPPVVNAGGTQSAVEAVLYQLNASFTDVDGDGPWTYDINWGDGTSSSGSLSAQGAIGPTHTYVLPGAYTITVTVTDAHGASGTDSKTLNVTL